MDEGDRIWNRSLEFGRKHELVGDIALADALAFHSSAMSGGVLDAVESRQAGALDATERAFVWLGLESAASVIAGTRARIDEGALSDDESADELEVTSDELYNSAIPSDAALVSAFRIRLAESPESFARA